MRKTLLAAASLMLASNAMASQVRMDSLQNSRTVRQDFVDMFFQPSVMWSGEVADQVLMEKNTGGFLMSSGEEAKYGIYFGRQPTIKSLINAVTAAAPFNENVNNPLHVFYGRNMGGMNWGFNLFYANSKRESVAPNYTQNFMGLAAGVDGGSWRADLALGLGAKIENTTSGTDSVKGDTNARLQIEYDVATDLRAYADVTQAGVTFTQSGTDTKGTNNVMKVGIERRMTKEANTFFYGVAIRTEKTEIASATVADTQTLPVYFGFEAEATSWLVLRGSINQHVLIGSSKSGSATDTLLGSPTYNAGAGVKLGNFLVDGFISVGSTAGNFGGGANDWMTNAAVTYTF
jgi:hypothetical protein